ncbi:Nif3-like dinuclear metal center hexameric protein [Patescibacteria group bacterium]|nr:Nif3-like dinuclear metal center hexameric protein [Patescibacteria group bacterium]MBU4142015.1 Nif3-like dinuclear metal center hexameric protein [Patescibacteria group bacterium]MBU4338238.1 Nif3-like dinuclear metal center hexameric protein [Patescibacteria group bacterium]MBU4580366.1 Nif3-like dinuclear metal center hexameric protein [Patescibacteria group bacterium]
MTIQEIYDLAIKMGIESDLRGKEKVLKLLARTKEQYEKLSKEEKEEFDMERLTNPYSDSRILLADSDKNIKKILAGIDIDTGEVLLADKLGVDLIIGHHPLGKALAKLDDVMHLQAEVLNIKYGVPINIAQGVIREKISEVGRSVIRGNYNQSVDAARLIKQNMICVHTPCDNLVAKFLYEKTGKEGFEYVNDLLKFLKEIPEYKEAIKSNAGPRLFAGLPENYAGKIAITEITGGTEGAPQIYEKMAQSGIGTIIGMHMSEEHKKEAEKAHINVVIAGHMSSDSLGMNLFLDELEKKGIEVIPCSGLIRVKRFQKR